MKRTAPTQQAWTFVGLLGLVVIVLLVLLWSPAKRANAPEGHETATSAERQTSWEVLDSSAWSYTEQAQKVINESQGKPIDEEELLPFVIQDPQDATMFYLSTFDNGARDNGALALEDRFAGIYTFSTKDSTWERLYRTSATVDEPGDPNPLFYILGIQDGKLIVRHADRPPTHEVDCKDPRGFDNGEIVAIDLASPYSAWEPAELPASIADEIDCN